ncbi:hypothetical protein [Microbulbifer aggregans]|uniref:hypothetical protein n=1 Tax=Microbulbifer aggregans TaxID=1769779 RepID=UPI001CFD878B|nr:hypothetical protein [Microbulbifer aggregans]
MPSEISWPELILSTGWMAKLDRLAHSRFGQQGLAEEASTYVIHRLSEDNWARCRTFSGQSRAETFAQVLAVNLLEEFARKRFGRPRPPTWLQREGELWVRLWKMVCLERQLVPSVIDRLCADKQREPSFIQRTITVIKARLPWCGDSAREIPAACLVVDNSDEPHPEQVDLSTEQSLDKAQWEDALLVIHQLLLSAQNPSMQGMKSESSKNSDLIMQPDTALQLQQRLDLNDEERLLLKMVYQDGLKLNVVAQAMNLPAYQPGRLLNRLHQRIGTALEACGISLEDLFRDHKGGAIHE